jgi:sensor c-di-GMP phosphodiesterase-like protein
LAKIVAVASVVATAPMLIFNAVLSSHAAGEGRSELRYIAERAVTRAEAVIGEGVAALRGLADAGHTDCRPAHREALAEAAFRSLHIRQIGIADADGTLLCAEPMGPLAMDVEMPAATGADPATVIGVVEAPGSGERHAIAALRADNGMRIIARFRPEVLLEGSGPWFLQDFYEARVFLEDGSEWSSRSSGWDPARDPSTVSEAAHSSRYPLRVIVTASASALEQTMMPLRRLSIIVSVGFGFLAAAIALWTTWSRDAASDDFSRAVQRGEFVPYYQPVMNIASGELEGCEVLVRWVRPDGTIVSPAAFLPYSEATGLIREITRSLMRQTVIDLADLYVERPKLKIGINLTASHFIDHEIIDEVREIYEGSGISYSQLMFEVTEQHPLKDIRLARAVINRIQRLGSAVALDDVGTGHGGLAYLQQLGIDIIKIDKLFIDKLGEDIHSDKIVDTLVELANTLGMGIIAEGVERTEQVELLRRIGVTSAQGYVFSPPIPAAAFRERVIALAPRKDSQIAA